MSLDGDDVHADLVRVASDEVGTERGDQAFALENCILMMRDHLPHEGDGGISRGSDLLKCDDLVVCVCVCVCVKNRWVFFSPGD